MKVGIGNQTQFLQAFTFGYLICSFREVTHQFEPSLDDFTHPLINILDFVSFHEF